MGPATSPRRPLIITYNLTRSRSFSLAGGRPWHRLPLEAMEQLLGMAEESGAGAGGARDRVLASYLRAYDGSGRLDAEAYSRLMRRHFASAHRPEDAGKMEDGAAREEDGADSDGVGIAAEDALLLLGMAARYAPRGGQSVETVSRRATMTLVDSESFLARPLQISNFFQKFFQRTPTCRTDTANYIPITLYARLFNCIGTPKG